MTETSNIVWSNKVAITIAEHYWANKPCLIDYPATDTFVTLADLFACVCEHRKFLRVWVARKESPQSLQDYLIDNGAEATQGGEFASLFGPRSSESIDDFFERLAHIQFGINLSTVGRLSDEIAASARIAVGPLIDSVRRAGHACAYNEVATFFGNYKSSPLTIHRDELSLLVVVLRGKRTYYTWPADYFDDNSGGKKYSPQKKYLNDAQRFVVEPGQLFYWPSSHWHYVSSDGEPSVTAQILLSEN